MQLVQDSTGRTLNITLDYGIKRIYVTSSARPGLNTVVATFTAKQALKLAAILTGHVRHIIDPDYARDD